MEEYLVRIGSFLSHRALDPNVRTNLVKAKRGRGTQTKGEFYCTTGDVQENFERARNRVKQRSWLSARALYPLCGGGCRLRG